MVTFIDDHRAVYGVEPICAVLPIASWRGFVYVAFVPDAGLIHHSDRGSQNLAIRYTDRLADAGIEPSVGSSGDAYRNALAETINGLYKAEVIYHLGPWKGVEDVESTTLEWAAWYNSQRLMGPLGYIPPGDSVYIFSRCRSSSDDH